MLWKNAWIDPRIDPALIVQSSRVPIDPLIDLDIWIDPRIDQEALCSLGKAWIDPLIDPALDFCPNQVPNLPNQHPVNLDLLVCHA